MAARTSRKPIALGVGGFGYRILPWSICGRSGTRHDNKRTSLECGD
jgi:hypothetical protein